MLAGALDTEVAMIERSYYRLIRWVRASISEALTFVREHYLFVEGVPQEYIEASFGRSPRDRKMNRDSDNTERKL
jgi:hypothetical protein